MSDVYEKHGWSFLTGDVNYLQYGGKFIYKHTSEIGSRKTAYVVLEVRNMEEDGGSDFQDQVLFETSIVSPPDLTTKWGRELFERVKGSCGWDDEDLAEMAPTKEAMALLQVEMLHSYGVRASGMHSETHSFEALDNDEKLLESAFEAAAKDAMVETGMTGFLLDRRQNAIGSTGWDFLKGDVTAGLRRM